jgi:hypothetical protein
MKHLSPEARSLVDASRGGDDPSSHDSARVKRSLLAGIAAGGVLSVPPAATAAPRAGALSQGGAGAVTSTKNAAWVAAGAAVGLATAGAWVGFTGSWSGAPPAPAAQTTLITPPPAVPALPTTPIAPTDFSSRSTEPSEASAAQEGRKPRIDFSSRSTEPSAATRFAIPAGGRAGPEGRRARRAEAAAAGGATEATPQSSSLSAETALLQAARAALGSGDAHGALALLRRHAREYPNGALVEERLASQVFASCALGQRANAARAAAELTRRAPSSPLRARVLDSCAGD